jgi:hypothetical protein
MERPPEWFLEITHLGEYSEIFEFGTYREALAFSDRFRDAPDVLAIEVIDFRGVIVLNVGHVFQGLGRASTPLATGIYHRGKHTAPRP